MHRLILPPPAPAMFVRPAMAIPVMALPVGKGPCGSAPGQVAAWGHPAHCRVCCPGGALPRGPCPAGPQPDRASAPGAYPAAEALPWPEGHTPVRAASKGTFTRLVAGKAAVDKSRMHRPHRMPTAGATSTSSRCKVIQGAERQAGLM